MQLRPYQTDVSDGVDQEWARGAQVVCVAMPTGSGKTAIFGEKLAREPGVTFAIAHRQELIGQISMALAKYGVTHSIQAPKPVVKWAIGLHVRAFGRHYYDPQAKCLLTGVITLLNRAESLSNAIALAKLWVIDEFHHCLRGNVWGKAVALFNGHAKGLGVTATPERADGRGIGRNAEGFCDALVTGPGMRDLITAGYLSDYRIFAPATDIDMSSVPVGSTGDFSQPKLIASVRKSTITGDIVDHYLRIAPGKLGVTFVPDVKTAGETAARFKQAGVPSEVVHAKTPNKERQESVAALGRGDIKNLVNVDIFGEGFDLPALEVCSFGRPTQSYPLYVQQFGRDLRIMDGKKWGIIIDHVGNVMRHGLPDKPRTWSLDSRDKRKQAPRDPDLLPLRTCTACTALYESYRRVCPFCGHVDVPTGRSNMEQVEGDLFELDPKVLAEMRGEVKRIDSPAAAVGDRLRHAGAPAPAIGGAMKNHRLRQEAQAELRHTIALWAGAKRAAGQPDDISYKQFYLNFGVDVLGAQALGRADAMKLKEAIGHD